MTYSKPLSLLIVVLMLSCTQKVKYPIDSENRNVRSDPPLCINLVIDLYGELALEGKKVSYLELKDFFPNALDRTGKELIIIFHVDRSFRIKDINRVTRIAAKSGIHNFAITVRERDGFINMRHFRSLRANQVGGIEKIPENIICEDTSLTIQELIDLASSRAAGLERVKNKCYYVIFED